jgi:hypothetical protein
MMEHTQAPQLTDHCLPVKVMIPVEPMVNIRAEMSIVEIAIQMMKAGPTAKTCPDHTEIAVAEPR